VDTPRPIGLRILGQPGDAGVDRRVMERDQCRPVRRRRQRRAQPFRPRLAKRAAMPPDLQRVEDDDPQRIILDRILDEVAGARMVGKGAEKDLSIVVIAHRREDRKGQPGQPLAVAGVGGGIVAVVGDVAGNEQQIGHGPQRAQHPQRGFEALSIEFVRIVRIEAEVQVGDLSQQHSLIALQGRSTRKEAETMTGAPRAA
jgi:hypothetical protein